jgi:hypothetical protein
MCCFKEEVIPSFSSLHLDLAWSNCERKSRNIPPAMSLKFLINGQYSRNMIVSLSMILLLVGIRGGMDASNAANRVSVMLITYWRQTGFNTILPLNEGRENVIPINFKSAKIRLWSSRFWWKLSPNQIQSTTNKQTYHDILNDSYTIEGKEIEGSLWDRIQRKNYSKHWRGCCWGRVSISFQR